MTSHRASNMGGGGRGSYAPYGDSPYGPTAPKHPARRGGQRSSLGPQVPETMDRTFDNDYTLNAGGTHQKHRHAHTSTSSGVYPPPPPPQRPLMVDRKYRNHGNDLATLRKKHAALEAKLQARAREGRPYDESDGENAEAIIFLFEIERDIARLEDGEVLDDGRGEERTGGMGFEHKKSHAGGRARPDARGHRGFSEIPNRSSTQDAAASQAGRNFDGSGHARRHQTMTEDDIAPPTRDFSRLGVEPRERGGKMPRPPRRYDFADHADEASRGHRGSEPQKRSINPAAAGRRSGHASRPYDMTEDNIAPPTRDFSRLGVRSREHGKTPRPARQHDFEDHANEASRGHRDLSELPQRSNSPAAERHLNGLRHISRHRSMTEDDNIAPPTRDFSRLGVRSREHGKTPRPARQHDFADHADEASRGHRGLSELPQRSNSPAAGRHLNGSGHIPRHRPMTEDDNIAPPTRDFSRLGVRSREHGKTPRPPRYQDLEDLYADEAPNYHRPREYLISGRHHRPLAGHGRSSSGRFADYESRAPSRHENAEDYGTADSVYQSRGSRHGSHLPPTSGHGRSSSGRFADYYSSR